MSAPAPGPRDDYGPDPSRRRAVMARDAGLRRIRAVTRWTAATVVALSGALALIAADAFHGHAATTTQTSSAGSSTAAAGSSGSSSDSAQQTQLQQPAQAPTQVQQTPAVVSGGS